MNSLQVGRSASWRVSGWYGLLMICLAVIVIRLFYIQIIRHDQYSAIASARQHRELVLSPDRGVIEAHQGDSIVPIVLNEKRYTIYAEPRYIIDSEDTAGALQKVLGGEQLEYEDKLRAGLLYVVLAKKVDKSLAEKILDLKLKGIGASAESYRTYPQGSVGSQTVGFVNDEGVASYGVEEYLDSVLKGTPGLLKAVTDASGVPLAANRDNVAIDPKDGARVRLTLDVGMQARTEELLKRGLDAAQSSSGSVVIIDPNTGAVKAMANYPTFSPTEFYKVESKDQAVFTNAVISEPLEVGSIMKPLTLAAALDQGVINENWTYFDPGSVTLDGATITNVHPNYGLTTLANVILLSLNTGATTVLAQMGGGTINEQARTRWHSYMVDKYHFGKKTGIEQGYEQAGLVPDPSEGYGLNIKYANTAFGQGLNTTLMQMAAAYSAIANGGTYYKPYLVESVGGEATQRTAGQKILSDKASQTIAGLLTNGVTKAVLEAARPGYRVGGKTGTAQIADPAGGYYAEKIIGTYAGFVGSGSNQYVIVVRVNQPGIPGFAGQRAAAPLFASISNMLIDEFGVAPGGP